MNYKGTTYKRIILVGSAGSGKSYLSRQIAEYTELPLIHLDNEYWKPGWTETPKPDWIERQKDLIAGDCWILDGNYNSTMELRFMAADCIIFLDINRWICMYATWKRHGKKRADLPVFLEERKDKEFFVFLKYIWNFPKKGRKSILQLHNQYPEKQFILLKNRIEVKRFIKQMVESSDSKDTGVRFNEQ